MARIGKTLRLPSIMKGGGLAFFAAVSFTNLINFLFQLVVARRLGPSSYGELGALTGILAVFAVPSAALQVVITAQVAGRLRDSHGKPVPLVIGPLLASGLLWGLTTTVILLAAAPVFEAFLHLSSLTPAFLLALYVLPTMIDLVPRGVLLGELRFIRVSVALVAGALVRFGLALVLAPSRGVNGAMAATVAGAVVTAALLLGGLRPFLASNDGVAPIRVSWKMASAAIVAFSGYWILNSADVFLGRHFFDAHDSGLYAAAATSASIALFVSGALATAAFPRFAAANGVGPAARAALVQALALTGVLGGLVAVAFAVAPSFIASTLFGSTYDASGDVIGFLAFGAVSLSLLSVLMQFHLAGQFSTAGALAWVGVGIVVLLTVVFHDSLTQVAMVKLGSVLFVTLLMLSLAFARKEPAERPSVNSQKLDKPEGELDLTMVVPYYNPGPALRANIENIVDVLKSLDISFEVIAVSDGATDGSEKSLEGLDPQYVRSEVLPTNHGKGQALRIGFALGRGRYLGFIDADGDVNPSLLEPYLALVKLYEPDVVLGSKRHPMSDVDYPPIRRIYSWGYQQLVRGLFRLNVRDTQTGLKLIRREVLVSALPRMVEKRFAFDLELFVVAQHLGFNKFFEAPVRIDRQFGSTISRSTWVGTLLDTLAIYYRLHLLHYYDKPRNTVTTEDERPVDRAVVPALPTSV